MDVTPPERRIWGAWTMLGFWLSDALNAQGWQAPAAILAVGLTWYVHYHHPSINKLSNMDTGAKQSSASSSAT
jgi:hypothetical protein